MPRIPYAARISANAAPRRRRPPACQLLALRRPPWQRSPAIAGSRSAAWRTPSRRSGERRAASSSPLGRQEIAAFRRRAAARLSDPQRRSGRPPTGGSATPPTSPRAGRSPRPRTARCSSATASRSSSPRTAAATPPTARSRRRARWASRSSCCDRPALPDVAAVATVEAVIAWLDHALTPRPPNAAYRPAAASPVARDHPRLRASRR